MHVGRPAHRAEIGQLLLVAAVELHAPDVSDQAVFVEVAPDDALAVREEERAAVVAPHLGQASLLAAIGAHDVDLAEVRRVDLEHLLLFSAQLAAVGVTHGREDDPLAVRRVAGLGVVAERVREADQLPSLRLLDPDLELRVVVPGVAALLAGSAKLELLALQIQRAGIVMRRAEQDVP